MSNLRSDNSALKYRLTEIGEIRPLQVRPLIFAYLRQLGDNLEFGSKLEESERLTLYLHDAAKRAFIPVSRYSNSAELIKCGRSEYPENQGCLSLVWSKGYYCDDSYPNATDRPDQYVLKCVQDGVPDSVVKRLRMKPRIYCGTVIWNKDKTQHLGALTLEATADRYQKSMLAEFEKAREGLSGRTHSRIPYTLIDVLVAEINADVNRLDVSYFECPSY